MRNFKLKKDLPGIPAGSILKQPDGIGGSLYVEDTGYCSGLIVGLNGYGESTLVYHPANEKTSRVDNLGEWLEEIEPEYKRWRASRGDEYFYLQDTGIIGSDKEIGVLCDDLRYSLGNYFETRDEADAYLDYLKALAVVRDDAEGFKPDWLDGEQAKVYVGYSHYKEDLSIGEAWYDEDTGVFGLPYFATKEDAEASIEKHEKEWKTIFGIKDEEEE